MFRLLNSAAVEFLLSHGFNMQAPFTIGVPYLSREEELTAMDMELARQDKAAIADIHLRSDEVESIQFVRKVREDIEKWKNRKEVGCLFHFSLICVHYR